MVISPCPQQRRYWPSGSQTVCNSLFCLPEPAISSPGVSRPRKLARSESMASAQQNGVLTQANTLSAESSLEELHSRASTISSLPSTDYRVAAPNVELLGMHEGLSKKDCLLFYYPEAEPLARAVASTSSSIELGKISWRNFADGFPNLYVQDAHKVRNRHVAFLASFQNTSSIFAQLSIIYQLPRMFVGSFTLVLPYFPTGTAERVEAEGDVATAFTLARMLSDIPLSRGGPTSLVIFDIHALQERFYFGDTVLPLFESGIPLMRNRIKALDDAHSVTIAYPDEGAWKRFHSQFVDFPEIICTKVRDGDKRIVRLKEGQPKDRHVVIVDDLVQSGGTLIECQKLLKSQGAAEVSAYVSHGVFPNKSWQKFTKENHEDGFKYFWISDSCPQTAQAIKGLEPFEIVSLAEPIAGAILI